ncbi:hypothetical protein [Paraburkholderia sp. J10-1]|uniref:hypothetical protein n=1 Tax=Paraburkholderia sp. J10-1 TaxID=2805430 RepID=UPI002AB76280|nr:hypothetical protein [Paraburkholderia sp. J10-1]
MNGQEVQRRLGMTASIVFVSAHGNMQSAIAAMKAGAVDFLEKPVEVTFCPVLWRAHFGRPEKCLISAGDGQKFSYESTTLLDANGKS